MTNDTESSCSRVRGRMAALVDGALAPLERARDEGHLEACARCAAEAARYRELWSAIEREAAVGAEEWAFATRGLEARLDADPRAGGRATSRSGSRPGLPLLRRSRGLAAVAAALLVLGALEFLGQGPSGWRSASPAGIRLPEWSVAVPGLSELRSGLWPLGGRE